MEDLKFISKRNLVCQLGQHSQSWTPMLKTLFLTMEKLTLAKEKLSKSGTVPNFQKSKIAKINQSEKRPLEIVQQIPLKRNFHQNNFRRIKWVTLFIRQNVDGKMSKLRTDRHTEKWRRQGYFDCSLLYEIDPLLRIIHVTLSRQLHHSVMAQKCNSHSTKNAYYQMSSFVPFLAPL